MGKLIQQLTNEQLIQNHSLLVPSIFTERQFNLLKKKLNNQKFSNTESAYFSRTISKKLMAINSLTDLENQYFIRGEKQIISNRKNKAIKLLKKFSRNHKNMKLLISGSFLYNKRYNDIDLFIVSKYEKEDYQEKGIHINYLTPDSLNTLFFHSLSQISISNFNTSFLDLKENINIDDLVMKYQEVMKDLEEKNYSWLKIDLRDFLIDCSYARDEMVLSSLQLKNNLTSLLKRKNKKEIIQKMFIYTLLKSYKSKEVKRISLNMIDSYKSLMKDSKNKQHFQNLINSFKEVLNCAG